MHIDRKCTETVYVPILKLENLAITSNILV